MPAYRQLNTESVTEYLLEIPDIAMFLGNPSTSDLETSEIGDGNLNFVYVVRRKDNPLRGVILKQATHFLRCIGEDFLLAKERMHFEIAAMQKYTELAPSYTPQIFHTDKENCVLVMQYLGSHVVMRKGLVAKNSYPNFAEHISTFLAETLFKTSSLYLSNEEKDLLLKEYNHNHLRKITEDFVFSFPYMKHSTYEVPQGLQEVAAEIYADTLFKENVLELKDLFMNKSDALVHGDLHTGSIMLNQDETFVIDPEFAYVGPMGFDIGAVLANLILSWVSHFERSKDETYQAWILQTILDVYSKFEAKFLRLWNEHPVSPMIVEGFLTPAQFSQVQKRFMLRILQESIGFAGCKMARRQLGVAGVEDIRGIQDPEARTRAEIHAVRLAREMVLQYKDFTRIDELLALLALSTRQNRERGAWGGEALYEPQSLVTPPAEKQGVENSAVN